MAKATKKTSGTKKTTTTKKKASATKKATTTKKKDAKTTAKTTAKATKAAASPAKKPARKAAPKKAPAPVAPRPIVPPTEAEIRERARQIWLHKGRPVGQDEVNWLEAEQQLRDERGA